MAAGLAVISRNIEPLSGFVAEAGDGLLLTFDGGAEDMDRLFAFLSQPEDSCRLGSKANRASAQRYSWRTAAERFLCVYKRLLKLDVAPSQALL